MLELNMATRLGILVTLLVVAGVGLVFYLRQNSEQKMGGGISRPKAVWLTYAIYVWFFMTPILAFDDNIAWSLRVILGLFSASMWLRGLAEVLMLYVWKNWRPPYGIAHDILSIAILGGGTLYYYEPLCALTGQLDIWVLGFVVFLVFAMICETYYAVNFHDAVEGQTTGDDGLWFASAEDEKFQRINRMTAICNTPLVGFVLGFIAVWAV